MSYPWQGSNKYLHPSHGFGFDALINEPQLFLFRSDDTK